jgi:hypothetical protein
LLPDAAGVIFLFLSSISRHLRSVLRAESTRWLKLSKVVQECVLNVIVQPLPEVLLLIAIIGDLSEGVASELEEMVTVLGHRHSSLK